LSTFNNFLFTLLVSLTSATLIRPQLFAVFSSACILLNALQQPADSDAVVCAVIEDVVAKVITNAYAVVDKTNSSHQTILQMIPPW
jgi:hypothetical protein